MTDSRLTHVVAVARVGSFTGAADKVGVTQSAITRSVADLERQIGYSLFVRTSRGAVLTERGRDFAERAQKLIDDTKELLARPRADEDAYAGVLRIGICPASMEYRLTDPLVHLLSRHPSVRLDVTGATFERVVQQLRNGGLDVAVGFEAAFAEWPDLKRISIAGSDNAVLFVRKGHPLLQVSDITPEVLSKYNFVSPSDSRPYGSMIRSIYEDQGVDWRNRVHIVDFFPMVRKVVLTTDAIGVVSPYFARESANFREHFVTLDTVNVFTDPAPMCCAIRARWETRPAVRAFISILQSANSVARFRA
jgi:DNA-binding transcriptional LysR family regulator